MENYKIVETFKRMDNEVKKESKLIVSESGREYELLEGYTFFGSSSSDILFIMEVSEEEGYKQLVDYVFGVGDQNVIEYCLEAIEEYERR